MYRCADQEVEQSKQQQHTRRTTPCDISRRSIIFKQFFIIGNSLFKQHDISRISFRSSHIYRKKRRYLVWNRYKTWNNRKSAEAVERSQQQQHKTWTEAEGQGEYCKYGSQAIRFRRLCDIYCEKRRLILFDSKELSWHQRPGHNELQRSQQYQDQARNGDPDT